MRANFIEYYSFHKLLIATVEMDCFSLFVFTLGYALLNISCCASALPFFSSYFAIQTKFVKLIHSKQSVHKTKMFIKFIFCTIIKLLIDI